MNDSIIYSDKNSHVEFNTNNNTLYIQGELYKFNYDWSSDFVKYLLHNNFSNINIDLGECTYVSSDFMVILIRLKKAEIVIDCIDNVNLNIYKLFQLLNIQNIFNVNHI